MLNRICILVILIFGFLIPMEYKSIESTNAYATECCPSIISPARLSLQPDKIVYNDNTVKVSGGIRYDTLVDETPVIVQIFNPEGKVYLSEPVPVQTNSTFSPYPFSLKFKIRGDLALPGNYQILAYYSNFMVRTSIMYISNQRDNVTYSTYVMPVGSVHFTSIDSRPVVINFTNTTDFYNVFSGVDNDTWTIPIKYKIDESTNLDYMYAKTYGDNQIEIDGSAKSTTNKTQLILIFPINIIDLSKTNNGFTVQMEDYGKLNTINNYVVTEGNNGTQELEIIMEGSGLHNFIITGTTIVPEFPYASLLLTISVGSLILFYKMRSGIRILEKL